MNDQPSGGMLRFVIAGCLNRDFVLPFSGPPQLDAFGGGLPYAAIGLNIWGETSGLMARVGKEYPLEWLERLKLLGFDLSGIRVTTAPIEARRFRAYTDFNTLHTQYPVRHFAARNLTFPPELLGFQGKEIGATSISSPSHQSLQISDVPDTYLEASAIHICPIDLYSHMILPAVFRQGQATTITLASDPGYMTPVYWEEIPKLLSDLTAFITTEEEVKNLFQGRQTDLWNMAADLGQLGPEFVVIQTEAWGYCLFDTHNGKRWMIPEYQSRITDPTGGKDAFAGGFLAGYRKNYDPLEAALWGSVAASLVVEGSGVYYALDAMPGLRDARLLALRELVREVT